ncbi:MAG TPA: ATP-binding protein [Gemmatimonadales bacterium]|nr:ATP-binding protein [Gemmatimonadales bacterium]
MPDSILRTEILRERDVVLARRRARQIAGLLGLDAQDQSRLATAVSEIARNAFQYAGGGRAEFGLSDDTPPMLTVRIIDRGPGIGRLDDVLDGRYVSATGMGVGIVGARRLMDRFEITSSPAEGTTVLLGKSLPKRVARVSPTGLAELSAKLAAGGTLDLTDEIQQQNQELLATLGELRNRQTDIERLNQELEDTNRGVVALYMELDARAQDLARAADLKSRVLSDISHEIRTPLNAILNVTRLLVDRVDGDLTAEQERQVRLIRSSATTLSELVNDLLELARMEAGKTVARVSDFSATDLVAALRGVFRPLLTSDAVELVFEDVSSLPTLHTDEGKLGQILRNLISNALKFTERGEVRVSGQVRPGDRVAFTVADTGIGISPDDLDRIFQEFSQVENPLQRRAQGTGLGLPLSRKLTEFLGGSLQVRSTPGEGSVFTAVIPVVYNERRVSDRADAHGSGSAGAVLKGVSA